MFTLPLLKEGDTVGIIACSDGIEYGQRAKIEELISVFNAWDLEVDVATTIYRRNSFLVDLLESGQMSSIDYLLMITLKQYLMFQGRFCQPYATIYRFRNDKG